MTDTAPVARPPSVDALARSLSSCGLPHPLLVDIARAAIANDDVVGAAERAHALARTLLRPVVNATGVLLHTNLGRAALDVRSAQSATNLELDLLTGRRGSRYEGVGGLIGRLCGADRAIVVNNGAAAVLLVLAALGGGRQVVVSRGESVEIGGGFRIPDVLAQSGAQLVDVGTTNRTRIADYRRAVTAPGADVACVLRVHPSNYEVRGFTETPAVRELAMLGVPVVVDLGSGLVDSRCPWLPAGPPKWLAREPAARQTIEAGAGLVTFSGDKIFAGPQAGIIAGRADLVDCCARHPLARALRPGSLVLGALQDVTLAYLRGDAAVLPFWRQATIPVSELRQRAQLVCQSVERAGGPSLAIVESEALPGAGSAPGVTIPSIAVALGGDHLARLRMHRIPVVARVVGGRTLCDLRSVEVSQDVELISALAAVGDP